MDTYTKNYEAAKARYPHIGEAFWRSCADYNTRLQNGQIDLNQHEGDVTERFLLSKLPASEV